MTDKQIPRPVARSIEQIGENLRSWRLLLRLTVEQVADRAEVNPKTVLNLEKGRGTSLVNVLRVARALGLLDQITAAFDPYESDVGRLRAEDSLPERVRHSREAT